MPISVNHSLAVTHLCPFEFNLTISGPLVYTYQLASPMQILPYRSGFRGTDRRAPATRGLRSSYPAKRERGSIPNYRMQCNQWRALVSPNAAALDKSVCIVFANRDLTREILMKKIFSDGKFTKKRK